MIPTDVMPLNEQDLAELAQARASFFAFLNVHFTTLPDLEFVQRIRGEEVTCVLDALVADETLHPDVIAGASLMRSYLRSTLKMVVPKLAEELCVDRTRLYRGVSPSYGPPPPNEVVWGNRASSVALVLQEIAEIYRQAEMAVSPEAHERLDYIGVELDFQYQLAQREAEAWRAGDQDKARGLLKRQADFLPDHLGQWFPAFVERALTYAETDFYRGHMQMLRGFLADEQRRLQELVEETRIVTMDPFKAPTAM